MARLLRSLLLTLLLPPLLAVLLAAGLIAGADTDSGRRLLVWALEEASDGRVRMDGLAGRLPFSPRLARLEVRDTEGVWLVVEGAALDLDPWALLAGRITVERLTALAVDLRRLPAGQGSDGPGLTGLPLRLELRSAAIGVLRIGPAGAQAPRLAASGRGAAGPEGFDLVLEGRALERGDRYRLTAGRGPERVRPRTGGPRWRLAVAIEEGPEGLLGGLLPPDAQELATRAGAWALWAAADGPLNRLDLRAALATGPVASVASGRLDLTKRATDGMRIAISASASSFAPPPMAAGIAEIAWEGLSGLADLTGPLGAPRGSLSLDASGLAAGDLSLGRLSARIKGDMDEIVVAADLGNLAAPALPPALLGPAVRLGLTANRTAAGWDIPAAGLRGSGLTAGLGGGITAEALQLDWGLDLRALDALAPGWPGRILGRGALTGPVEGPVLSADLDLALEAIPGLRQAPPARLRGRLQADLSPLQGSLSLTGDWAEAPLAVHVAGRTGDGGAWSLTLSDLKLAGLSAAGELFGAAGTDPVYGVRLPTGELRLRADDLGRLAPLVAALGGDHPGADPASALAGRLAAEVQLDSSGEVRFSAQGEAVEIGKAANGDRTLAIDRLELEGRIADLLGTAGTAATLRVAGLDAGPLSGDLLLRTAGPARDLELAAEAALAAAETPVEVRLAGRLQAPERRLRLDRVSAEGLHAGLRLESPAVLDLRGGLAVDRLRLALVSKPAPGARRTGGSGNLDLAGRLLPELDLRARAANIPLDLPGAAIGLPLAGSLDAEAELGGSLDAPRGRLTAEASGLRFTEKAGRALPPAQLDMSALLEPEETTLDARLEAGPRTRLSLGGRIGGRQGPEGQARRLDLRARGRADLALLDPLLAAGGRQSGGEAVIDARIEGTSAAPRLAGTLRLTDAALHDRALGISVTDIAGTLRFDGERLRSDRLAGRAGEGEVTLAGSVGVLAQGMPVDLRLSARDARLIQLDLLEADGSVDLRLAGPLTPDRRTEQLQGGPVRDLGVALLPRLGLRGRVDLTRAELRIPERLPAGVATLEVRERGQRRRRITTPPRVAPPLDLALDLTLSAPRAVFVTGRGIDAELGGQIQASGSLTRPRLTGGLELRRGELVLTGHTLRFTRGRLGFDGGGKGGPGLDPSLDLEARASAAGGTAILAVRGSVQSPRIELRGEPELPEDEVLSRLLFGTDARRLSGLQAARLGLAAAELAGLQRLATIGEGTILRRARSGLGLDRLAIDEDERGGAVLEGGRQLSEGFYLGARQGQRAGETQGVLRIEITPQLKLEADVGTSGGSRAGAAFQLDY